MKELIRKANKLLATMEASGADATVINAQKAHIKKLQEKETKELTIPENASIYIKIDGEAKRVKICKARNQRSIKPLRVSECLQIITEGSYEQGLSIILMTVAKAKELGLTLEDFMGNDVTETADETWIVIVDGQHRSIAAAIFNNEVAEEGTKFIFENTILKEDITNYGKYLASINGKETSNFSNEDRIDILALRDSNDELTNSINEYKNKISLSTLERAMTGGVTIAKSKYSKALKENVTLSSLLSEKESSKLNIQLGEKLLDACLATRMSPKRISRYWIEGFYGYVAAHDETKAFEAIAKITLENYISISSGHDFTAYLKSLNEIVVTNPLE